MGLTKKNATTPGIKDSYIFATMRQLLTDGTAESHKRDSVPMFAPILKRFENAMISCFWTF